MELDYVTLAQAKQLKKLGFDLKLNTYLSEGNNMVIDALTANWNDSSVGYLGELFSAPTVALALKWLRKKEGFNLVISDEGHSDIPDSGYTFFVQEYCWCVINDHQHYDSYETCESKGLNYILNYLMVDDMLPRDIIIKYDMSKLQSILKDDIGERTSGYCRTIYFKKGNGTAGGDWSEHGCTSGVFERTSEDELFWVFPPQNKTAEEKFKYIANRILGMNQVTSKTE